MAIHRVGVQAKPSPHNRDYDEWEVANISIFIVADDGEMALTRAREFLTRRRWELLAVTQHDRLIDERVREQGGEVLDLYDDALRHGAAMKVFPKNFGAGREGIPTIRPPRVTEAFIDTVVNDVGGVRLPTDDEHKMADYRIDQWLFELKDLQLEGLQDDNRQRKLAELFASYTNGNGPIVLDPSILMDEERARYYEIIAGPLKKTRDAGRQIKSTKEVLGDATLRGGIIYLNTGYGSFPHGEFGTLVEQSVHRHTSQIEAVFAISTYTETNGFDSWIHFQTHLSKPEHEVLLQLREAFGRRFEEAMTKLVRGELPETMPTADPLTPVAFTVDGLDFAWMPPPVPRAFATLDNTAVPTPPPE